jgi:hypothetical protein
MQCIHKRFCVQRTVFLFLFLTFVSVSNAWAQSALFTVEDVTVDITSSSAVAAREEAFEKAQLDAFTILAGRMLSGGAATQQIPDVDTISTMIQDYQISNEQLSTVRYVATYKFRFDDNAVRRYFNAANVPFTEVSANPALVLPFYTRNDQMILWSPYNVWLNAWNRADNLDGLVPLVVPLGDIADVSDIGGDEALDYNNARLNRLLQRYKASEAVILVATPDETLARVSGERDAAAGSMNIQIYRTDRGYPEQVQGVQVNADGNDTLASLMDKAVTEVQKAMRSDWKQKAAAVSTADAPIGQNTLRVRVPYNSLKEWADTQRALRRVYGLSAFKVVSVSPKQASVDIMFDGDENRLAMALAQVNLHLDQAGGGQSMVQQTSGDSMSYYADRGGSSDRQGNGAVYDLYLKNYRR